MTRAERFEHIIAWFTEHVPVAESELNFSNSYECIVAVMLSAQCTDKRVNMVTPAVFKAYPDVEALAKASFDELFPLVKSISYPNAKTEHLIGMAQKVVNEYHGEIPSTTGELTTLPGVGRKTANVVQAVIWGKPTMAVDTHIFRVSERIGLTTHSKSPLQTEQVLTKYIPEEIIPKAHHWLLLHGRYTCIARKPKCEECGIREYCRYAKEKGI